MTTLNYDANGFIVGINRMKDGIDNVHDDTQEIIQILKSQNQIGNTRMRELTRAVKSASYRSESQASANTSRVRSESIDRQPRISASSASTSTSQPQPQPTVSRSSSRSSDRSTESGDNPSSSARRERDANGRFISDGSDSKKGFSLPSGGMGGMGRSDVGGMDPVLDSLKEAKDLLSPIGRAGRLAGRATKFSWSKFKALKRREPLSNDETRHNRDNEKLLDKIWKAIKKQGGGAGGRGRGMLGGLLGGLGLGGVAAGGGLLKKIGKLKFLGPLAALASMGSLALDWGNLDHEGKSEGVGGIAGAAAGGLAGMKLGAMAGAFGGPIGVAIGGVIGGVAGAWFGSEGGEALGAAASPYIQDWTESLKHYKLAEKMDDFWKGGMTPVFSSFHALGEQMRSWLASKFDGAVDFVTGGSDSVWTGETANLSGVSAKAVHTASQYKAGNIGGLDDAMTRRLVASTVQTESAGGNPSVVNSGGYLGRYQAGAAWLADAGMIKGGAENVKRAKKQDGYAGKSDWAWASSGGMTKFLKDSRNWTEGMSREKYLSSPEIQDKAFQKATSKSYDQLKRMGAITSNTPQTQVAGLLKAAHLGGVGNANKVANGAIGATDSNGTSTRKYYNDIVQNNDGLNDAIRDKTVVDNVKEALVVEPSNKNGDKIAKIPQAKSGSGILGVSVNDINKSVAPSTPNITSTSSSGTPLKSNLGYEPANLPASPVLKIPAAPKIKERLDSGSSNKPIMLQSSNDTINQNLSDRGLAHAVTGGFGQDRMWG